MADPRVVHVEVNGQRYPIRSSLDPVYVQELASYVDRKLRIAFDSAPSSDTLGLAILAALNIADEFFRARDSQLQVDGSVAARAGELERIVDQALELAEPADANLSPLRRGRYGGVTTTVTCSSLVSAPSSACDLST